MSNQDVIDHFSLQSYRLAGVTSKIVLPPLGIRQHEKDNRLTWLAIYDRSESSNEVTMRSLDSIKEEIVLQGSEHDTSSTPKTEPQEECQKLVTGKKLSDVPIQGPRNDAAGVLVTDDDTTERGVNEKKAASSVKKYTKKDIPWQRNVHKFRDAKGNTAWFPSKRQDNGRLALPPDQNFDNKKVGDLCQNWVEYPNTCQIWRFNGTSWDPVKWGFLDPTTNRRLIITSKEHTPSFVGQDTYDKSYKKLFPGTIIL